MEVKPYQKDPIKNWSNAYKLLDYFSSALIWTLFFIYRKINEIPSEYFEWSDIWNDEKLYWGILIIPLGWMILYIASSQYEKIERQSRIILSIKTLTQSILGGIVLLLTVLVDDDLMLYKSYVSSFLVLVGLHFLTTYFFRFTFLTFLKYKMRKGGIAISTILVGEGAISKAISSTLKNDLSLGYNLLGLINDSKKTFSGYPYMGSANELRSLVKEMGIKEVIFAKEEGNGQAIQSFLNDQYPILEELQLNISAHEAYSSATGRIKIRPIRGLEILAIDLHEMPKWERIVKRICDVLTSVVLLILLAPLILWIVIRVKVSSKGPIIFAQERIGLKGKVFRILKFRSMYQDSEKKGPELSFEGDARCTPFGAFMRKWRLDEIPQFVNVILGDMSLVGPRPERRYFIDELMKTEPRYNYLLSVRPGITSLGQVKYGYASDLQQMQKRLKFDLLYMDNRSLRLDIKILFYTLLVLLQGQGK